jgi:hypothetical protein
MKRVGIILFVSFIISPLCSSVYSQESSGEASAPDAKIIYNQQAVGGLSAHTEGWGFFYRRAKILDIYKKIFWETEAVTMHSQQEYKTSNPTQPDASSYYFGKLNGMEAIRLGAGVSRMIWRKNDLSCVQIDAVYSAGFSLAILKPVWLDILENGPTGEELQVPEKYDPNQDTPSNIYGRASVFDGLNELAYYPGLYGRAGFNFDFSNRHKSVKALELGLIVDAYKDVIPMMAFSKNNQVFANLYLSISFGKRWI